MINIFLNNIVLFHFQFLVLFFVFYILTSNWNNIYKFLSLKPYNSKQKLHNDEVPRIGGIVIYIFLIFMALNFFESHLLNIILFSAIPIVFIGFKEDIFQNTSPKLRLLFMFFSASLFIFLLPSKLPIIDLPILNQFLTISFINEIFFIFAILVIINGNNLIDGVNGNMTLTNIVQLIVLSFLAFSIGDNQTVAMCVFLIIPLVIFLIFNFPSGKIFCGDAGAYFNGFAISTSVIYLFGKHDQLLSWNAVLLLIYPSIELLFSFIRKKIYENKSAFTADAKHLHSLIYRYMNKKNSKYSNNSMVTFYLLPFIGTPLLTYFLYEDIFAILFIIFLSFIVYISMYLYLLNKLSKQ